MTEETLEVFLQRHDAQRTGGPITHTNMYGARRQEPSNSGKFSIPSEERDHLKELYLAAERRTPPATHGIVEILPPIFSYFVDLDPGAIKNRPTKALVLDWAVSMAKRLQQVLREDAQLEHVPPIYIMQIAARPCKGGFQPGVHLHMPDLLVNKRDAKALTGALLQRYVAPEHWEIQKPPHEVLDSGVYDGSLRTLFAQKRQDGGQRYRFAGVFHDGESLNTAKLSPTHLYDAVTVTPQPGRAQTNLAILHKRSSDTPVPAKPPPQLPSQTGADGDYTMGEPLPVPEDDTEELALRDLIVAKVAQHYRDADVREVKRKTGTVHLVTLSSTYCWIKGGEHDSPSAFLTVTVNGIQPQCQSSVCKSLPQLQRKPVFSQAEKETHYSVAAPESDAGVDPVEQEVVEEYNRRFAHVMVGGESSSMMVAIRNSVDPLTGVPSVKLVREAVFQRRFGNELTIDRRRKVDIWLKSNAHTIFDDVVFLPEIDTEADGYFNLWCGYPYTPWQGEVPEVWEEDDQLGPTLKFIKQVIANGEDDAYEYVLNWLAHTVQFPSLPIEVILCLRGPRGIGKSFFAGFVSALFGCHGNVVPGSELAADFNGHCRNTVLLVADETCGTSSRELMAAMQHLSTAKDLRVNMKHVEKFRVRNCLHIIMCSNFKHMITAGRDARRYCILDVSPERRNDDVYFRTLAKTHTSLFFSKLLRMLRDRNVNGWVRTQWPAQTYRPLWENKLASLDIGPRWLYHYLLHSSAENWREHIACATLERDLVRAEGGRRPKHLRAIIEDACNEVFAPHNIIDRGEGVYQGKKLVPAYRLPSLAECREAYQRYTETPGAELSSSDT